MNNAQLTTLKIINADPELRSYIYQQLSELDPFVTPTTQILVLSKEPKNKSQHRLSIVMSENGTQIQAEATHKDIYHCVRQAKQKLFKQLVAIQDEVISNQERLIQIEMAGTQNSIH
ncbi:MAG TPA: ribosome-associated translation inhibitor RaiA [Pseudobdellovibrionaceae bacterium]|nr:ribosome-associated translation inhibitor RaiA [Pseudobdellovibrionaceae bacterium]